MPAISGRSRELIYSAFFNVLQNGLVNNPTVPVVTFSRRFLVDPLSMPSNAMPALIQMEIGEKAERSHRGLIKYHLGVLILYFFQSLSISGTGSPPPVTAVNNILDAIEEVVLGKDQNGNSLPPGTVQTLGGMVNDVFFEGTIEFNQEEFDIPGKTGLISIPVILEVGI
jgi:hypothetical protein